MRHVFISRLVTSGANVKMRQELARHGAPGLTLARYAHVQIADRAKALEAIPSPAVPEP
jgi:site-specific recombinase XerD